MDWEGKEMKFTYNDSLGLTVNGKKIPDPAEWNYQIGDLDTSGRRDATGLLHRKRVATKINYEFSWNALEWNMLTHILGLINAEKFTLVAPDPRTFDTKYKGDYYVGDRTGKVHYFRPDGESNFPTATGGVAEIATYTLKLKFIEY